MIWKCLGCVWALVNRWELAWKLLRHDLEIAWQLLTYRLVTSSLSDAVVQVAVDRLLNVVQQHLMALQNTLPDVLAEDQGPSPEAEDKAEDQAED